MDLTNDVGHAKIVILTDNMMEATDLKDLFDQMTQGPVLILRDPIQSRTLLEQAILTAKLVVFGWPNSQAGKECLDLCAAQNVPLVMIDGAPDTAKSLGVPQVLRPFTTDDFLRALRLVDICPAPLAG